MDTPEPIDMVALGGAIQRRREELRWTRNRLATRAGVSHDYLARIEWGKTGGIGLDVLVRLALALRAPVGELLIEAGLPPEAVDPQLLTLSGDRDPAALSTLLEMARLLRRQD